MLQIREQAYDITSNMLLSLTKTAKFPSFYRLLQIHFELDKGLLLSRLLTKHHQVVDKALLVEFALRALFSRSERLLSMPFVFVTL